MLIYCFSSPSVNDPCADCVSFCLPVFLSYQGPGHGQELCKLKGRLNHPAQLLPGPTPCNRSGYLVMPFHHGWGDLLHPASCPWDQWHHLLWSMGSQETRWWEQRLWMGLLTGAHFLCCHMAWEGCTWSDSLVPGQRWMSHEAELSDPLHQRRLARIRWWPTDALKLEQEEARWADSLPPNLSTLVPLSTAKRQCISFFPIKNNTFP